MKSTKSQCVWRVACMEYACRVATVSFIITIAAGVLGRNVRTTDASRRRPQELRLESMMQFPEHDAELAQMAGTKTSR